MITGTTSSGFEFEVAESITDDFRFVLAYAEATGEDPDGFLKGTAKLVKLVLGNKGADKLSRHVQRPDGSVPTSAIFAELGEILTIAGKQKVEVKN